MPDPVTVILLGEPVAASRPRFTRNGRPYNEPKKVNNSTALMWAASEAMTGRQPFDCALRMDVEAQFAIPPSWSKRKREAALRGEIRPTKRPDLSNVVKQIEDACNNVIYVDDAQIVEYGRVRKVYSNTPKVVVTISPIAPPLADMVRDMPRDTLDRMIDAGGSAE